MWNLINLAYTHRIRQTSTKSKSSQTGRFRVQNERNKRIESSTWKSIERDDTVRVDNQFKCN